MLRIKYFKEFKNGAPFLVILSDRQGLKDAHEFLRNQREAHLNDTNITEMVDISPLSIESLHLTISECQSIAKKCIALYKSDEPAHAYFDTKALGSEIEGIISYNEYDDLF